mmetsp:Transcript_2380/g.5471  ORF Transcript_2380/g.5471 Transcript_2380/m.5471 type:complete len:506 (-) Transcript_2380:637-2154(-)
MKILPPLLAILASCSARSTLMDASGSLRLKISDAKTSQGVVSIVFSPDTKSFLTDSNDILSLESTEPPCLICRGATLSGTSVHEGSALSTSSVVSDAILMDGITHGDVEAGWSNSRHARTVTALFRARLSLAPISKQLLILCVHGQIGESESLHLEGEAKSLFDATAAEVKSDAAFSDMYDISIVSVDSKSDADDVLSKAFQRAEETAGTDTSLASALEEAHNRVIRSGVAVAAKDPPHIAQAFVTVGNALTKQTRTVRAKLAVWKNRISRGLWVEGFGSEAESVRQRVLANFDSETLAAAGLPLVASYRMEMRAQLTSLIDSSIRNAFTLQVSNINKSIEKKLRGTLLKTVDASPEAVKAETAVALQSAMSNLEKIMAELEVPSLGLSKAKICREAESRLTDLGLAVVDSPAAQLRRTKKVMKVTNKEKKPGQRSVGFGLDLVAMLRPDGFGNLQGFAGYQYGGNSFTFGVHNDADDPQTVAQFGGVRPPLLRIQPKLRVDVEL